MVGGFGRSASPSRCQPFGPQPAAPSSRSGIANAAPGYRHWTEEESERLIQLMLAGLTRRQIAAELGRGFRAVKHRLCTGSSDWRFKPGETWAGKLAEDQAREVRRRALAGSEPQAAIASDFGVHPSTVSDIKTGKTWRHI